MSGERDAPATPPPLAEDPGLRGQGQPPPTEHAPAVAPTGEPPAAEQATTPPPADAPADDGARRFLVDGIEWTARLAGRGAGGTGVTARACLVALHFYHPDNPGYPAREALTVHAARFPVLYDEELAALLAASRAVPPPESG